MDATWQRGPLVSLFSSLLSHLSVSLSSSPLLARGPRILSGGRRPALGYAAMAAWLAVLFYLLADTAAVYFYPSLEGLARLLGLPPAIAKAMLLSLGNGAPDALSALASFAAAGGGGAAAIGLNGLLCVAMFVSATDAGSTVCSAGRCSCPRARSGGASRPR